MKESQKDSSVDAGECGETTGKQGRVPVEAGPAAKAVRAVIAGVVFGIPLLAGTAVLLGYGVCKAYKGITGKS